MPKVDQEHQQLVNLMNKLGKQLTASKVTLSSLADIEVIFQELATYAQYHFKSEEEMMCQIGLDQRHLDFHHKEHLGYLQEVTSMYADISPDNPDTSHYLMDFLAQWLAYHILGTDQNMARQVKAIQSGSSPVDAYETEERMKDNATEPLLVALNGLFRQIATKNKKLVELNKSLEAKVTERTKALSEANLHLEELSSTDVLTGLPNRRHLMRKISTIWDESIRSGSPLACMMIDADHFKEINDTYGHDAGDAVLCKLSETLQDCLQTDDFVGRLGGDEFLIICPDTDQNDGLLIGLYP